MKRSEAIKLMSAGTAASALGGGVFAKSAFDKNEEKMTHGNNKDLNCSNLDLILITVRKL